MPWSDPGGNGNNNNNNNNPWGRRPNPQKPAFDIQKITQELKKLGALLGSGKGRGSGGPKWDPRWLHRLPIIIIGILILFWIASGIYIVGPNAEGVVLRFGKEVGTTQPGLHYHLPVPFESVSLLRTAENQRIVLGYSGAVDTLNPGMMLTANGDVVDVHFAVDYRISNASHYLFSSTNPEQLIRYAALSAMRNAVGKSQLKALMHVDQSAMAQQIQQSSQNLLTGLHAGVTINAVQILSIHLPKPVQASYTDVMTAREDMARSRREAEAYASSIIPKAKGEAATMVTAAEAYKLQVVGRAKGDAARFTDLLQAYQKNPQVVSERMYLHTMQDILGSTQKVIMDSHGKAVIYLHMPEKTAAQPSASTRSVASATAADRSTAPVANTDSAASQPVLPVSGARS
ncbi:FtsH protease activity modulator HflK [Acidithiobacillus thiooxidans]|uniref:Protein HflK n=1 Tax=Acidithiobacillus thiooxidans ATCC 19377 TaxID=637390 RepID=A0A5P9XP47_ACITH|nr:MULTISPECIES: FtsH protease activity modulator HflK [Acidithiobacillus]MBU2741157.1 FtsH protease activity modulator HflK [Acidithiobacillus albertensis]MBU2750206.1 FtsH protease activity modulator HflK [Acidithiobacillus thiooxidans]MBU2837251.1 FtsH protease activity modulator HflK [Acidithiobacillus thiooxidans]MDA8175983.1 FtsH protease activity modulator HflK [Acidithiobacillus sp.]QFX95424.1 HflK protein [Acidithiobacillus thiooxidans ATCC 19377]